MELDKRIKALTDIQSVTDGCHDWQFMTKKGYFADRIANFQDLSKCEYGEYVDYREHDKCFHCEVILPDGTSDYNWFSYFIPEDWVLPEEEPKKKYRPYTLAEWVDQHEIGEVIRFRNTCNQEFNVMYLGYILDTNDDIQDTRTKGQIMFVSTPYTLQELFERYEICINGEWKPFGVLNDEE